MDCGAITIDNTSLRSEGYQFDKGLLGEILQFKDSPMQVIQIDIVHNEAIKHIGLD
ncbi:hypothetical protein [Bathymodiolus thermophilus thioautotrophic gill symbiont]|uniref:hypothetical protein n=1 Tax=Bathymodiolus thermophilus thioautotrophic gill symbiont TaxID=2360 RepID=UPI0013014620|nr:hypothetical protein [Bathymodiolus thermophilus thioautotrophic gill symbiont]